MSSELPSVTIEGVEYTVCKLGPEQFAEPEALDESELIALLAALPTAQHERVTADEQRQIAELKRGRDIWCTRALGFQGQRDKLVAAIAHLQQALDGTDRDHQIRTAESVVAIMHDLEKL